MSEFIGRTLLERYRVDAFLGKGGMAEVYKVWDPKRSVHLAMKVLHADLAKDRKLLQRAKREAEIVVRLQHPSIVRFYGFKQDADLVFVLMDHMEGELRQEIRRTERPFTSRRILETMQPVCAAVAYAHNDGVIHSEVRPENIMIDSQRRVRLGDFGVFGLTRIREISAAIWDSQRTPGWAAAEYLPSEQTEMILKAQNDIYALGVVLFEMLTGGKRPFTGTYANTTSSLTGKLRWWEQPDVQVHSPRKFNAAISNELEAVVLRCLEKDRSSRYASALQLLEALQTSLPELG